MSNRAVWRRMWYGSLRQPVRLAAVAAYRVRHTGRENIPSQGGVLVVSNHQSHFDPPLVGMGCPRHMSYLARASLFGFGPFRWLIGSLGAIPIEREGIGFGGIKESLRRLKRGEIVLVFPEGTRTRDGEIGVFRPGFATLAKRSKAAILPVAIEGAYDAWPYEQRFPRLGTIHVHYGAPILPDCAARLGDRELQAEVERRIHECRARLRRHPVFCRRRPARPTR